MPTTLPTDSAERKDVPLYSALFRLFPAALAGCAKWVKFGNAKHCPGGPLQHARGVSADHADCILRHLMDLEEDFGCGKGLDENGNPQVDAIVWRAMALSQEWHELHSDAPVPPGAYFPFTRKERT